MSNIFDYLEWRGDLTFAQDPFHDLDALVFSQIAYFEFENIVSEEDHFTIAEAWEKMKDGPVSTGFVEKSAKRFFEALSKSKRYKDLEICHMSHKLDEEMLIQFAVLTVLLPDGTPYISFRGTDLTIVGWKEDFYLMFPEAIPAQLCAAKYVEEIVKTYGRSVYLGGHSKGGNLALYAATVVPEEIQNQIQKVYVHDGPGLTKELFQSEAYERIKGRLQVIMPEQSMVGILLMHPEEYQVVKSSAFGIMQHDSFSWQVLQTHYEQTEALKKESIYMEHVVRKWLHDTEEEERRRFIEAMFGFLHSTKAVSLDELAKLVRKNPRLLLQTIHEIDSETHKEVMQTMGMIAGTAFHEATSEIRVKSKKMTRKRARKLLERLPVKNHDEKLQEEFMEQREKERRNADESSVEIGIFL